MDQILTNILQRAANNAATDYSALPNKNARGRLTAPDLSMFFDYVWISDYGPYRENRFFLQLQSRLW
jgi:hypothetical protein